MDGVLASECRPGELAAPVREDLVDIHVELGPASAHPHVQRELIRMSAGKNFVRNSDNQVLFAVSEDPEPVVDLGRGFFQHRISRNQLARHQVGADRKILERALGLSPPKFVGRNENLPVAVRFCARGGAHHASKLDRTGRKIKSGVPPPARLLVFPEPLFFEVVGHAVFIQI